MAKAKTKTQASGLKVSFGKKRIGSHTKSANKHNNDKPYVGQGKKR